MANRGYTDIDNHTDPSGGDHSTGRARPYNEDMLDVSWPTCTAAQLKNQGWTTQELPMNNGDDPKLRPGYLTGGTADSGGRYDVAAYPSSSAG